MVDAQCVHLCHWQFPQSWFRPNYEVGANVVPPIGVPRTKIIPRSCSANMPKSGYFSH